jgi:hypothetical protein
MTPAQSVSVIGAPGGQPGKQPRSTTQIDDAVASLDPELTGEEITALERPYAPRYDQIPTARW